MCGEKINVRGCRFSGAVRNLTISNNKFIDCAYNSGAKGAMILTVRIIGNQFESDGREPVISKSVRALIIE